MHNELSELKVEDVQSENPDLVINTGKLVLNRKNICYQAAYCINRRTLPDLLNDLPMLHAEEMEYYEKLQFEKRRLSYLLGRTTAKKAIGMLTGNEDYQMISIDFGVFQFPVVKAFLDYNIQVSITHCDDIGIALAFPEAHPLAVDLEKIDVRKIQTIKKQVSQHSLALLENCSLSMPLGCTMLWTIKEGLSKIFRTGLTIDLKLLEIDSLQKTGVGYESTFTHFMQYKALSFHCGGYVCSIVLPRNTNIDLQDLLYSFKQVIENKNQD